MGLRVGARLVGAGLSVLAAVAAVSPALALSCARHPDASPESIAKGTERLSVDGSFRDHYDGAVFGTVQSITTQNDGADPNYGWTEVVIAVTGTYGTDVASPAVIVEDDPGWLNGYAFEIGDHYFIPYARTEQGMYSHVCDPITVIDQGDVPQLLTMAADNAWPPPTVTEQGSTALGGSGPIQPSNSDAKTSAQGDSDRWIPIGAISLVILGVAFVARYRPNSGKNVSGARGR